MKIDLHRLEDEISDFCLFDDVFFTWFCTCKKGLSENSPCSLCKDNLTSIIAYVAHLDTDFIYMSEGLGLKMLLLLRPYLLLLICVWQVTGSLDDNQFTEFMASTCIYISTNKQLILCHGKNVTNKKWMNEFPLIHISPNHMFSSYIKVMSVIFSDSYN